MLKDSRYLALLRHEESEANSNLKETQDGLYYSNSGSDLTVPLTARGLASGVSTGKKVAALFPYTNKIQTAFHSDYLRTRQSLAIVAGELGYPLCYKADSRLNKRSYGHFWNLTRRGVAELHAEEYRLYRQLGDLNYRPPGGENYYDVFARTASFLRELKELNAGNTLVVTHSVWLLACMRELESLPDQEVLERYENVSLPNGALLLYRQTDKGWQRVDTLFLKTA